MLLHMLKALLILACLCGSASAQVCQIRGADGSKGSAVCIGTRDDDGSGVFFTAGHCIDSNGTWLAPDGKWMWAEPWAYWASGPGKDFALVYCRGYKPRAIYDLGKASPAVGEEVAVCGFAHAGQLTVQRTRIRRHQRGYMDLECRGVQGVSGGPILVGKTVVGILTHDDVGDQCGIATNIETILGALKSWRASPGRKETAWGFGAGIGSSCGPYGCRPFVPMYPAVPVAPVQPYYAAPQQPYAPHQQPYNDQPQQPGYPGFATNPQPTTPTTPAQPTAPSEDLTEIRKALNEIKAAQAETDIAIASIRAIRPKDGRDGEPGPPGPPGRDGINGKDGVSADPNELAALRSEVAAIRAIKIPVRIVDNTGKVLSEAQYELGKPLEFRFTEQK